MPWHSLDSQGHKKLMFLALHSALPESTGWECDGGHRPGWQGKGAGGNDAPSLEMPGDAPSLEMPGSPG